MTDNTYNGWTNYETWSVNLERFDGLTVEDIGCDSDTCAEDLGDILKEITENDIDDTVADIDFKSILYNFMRKVNWTEIAEHIIDNSNNG